MSVPFGRRSSILLQTNQIPLMSGNNGNQSKKTSLSDPASIGPKYKESICSIDSEVRNVIWDMHVCT